MVSSKFCPHNRFYLLVPSFPHMKSGNKATKKQTVRFKLNERGQRKDGQDELIMKRKSTWRKDLITYNNHLGLCFPLIDWLSLERSGWLRLKLDVQGQGGGRTLDADGQGGGGSWKLDKFQGRLMCIILYICNTSTKVFIKNSKLTACQ